MSHQVEQSDGVSGLDTLDAGPTFDDGAAALDEHHHASDHLALIYETDAERLAAVVQYLHRGLERGEQCLYVVDEHTPERHAVLEALRDAGVDVDAALESGQLTFHTVQETYLREQPFDPEAMLGFYADAIEAALADHPALRVVAGTAWIEAVDLEAFMEYEGRVNALFDAHDAAALCLYDRNQLAPSIIRDVIQTHPHLVYDGTVCHNFYYTPPEELFGPDEPDREIDRLLRTLRDRTQAKAAVAEHKRYLRELNEITASPDRSFESKLQAMFELGCERFDLDLGGLARVDPADDRFVMEDVSHDNPHFEPGVELPLSETFCAAAADVESAASVSDPRTDGYDDITVYRDFGIRSYIGTYVAVDGAADRTFFFVGSEARSEDFTDDERSFVRLMGQWVRYELERERNEQALEETIDRLRQTNDRLEQFAYAASHDLQEPLRMVSSYLQLLEEEYGDALDADAAEYIEFAVDGAERMRAMVEDLLAFARVEQADETLEPVDCNLVLDRVRTDLEVQIAEADAEVTVGPLPTLVADPDQLEQLFVNLLANAIKYSEGIPRVEVDARRVADGWEFTVADDGIGIPPDKTEQIFEVFNRLHHDDEYPGTGIGLALCQEIVENHGGRIRVESEPGEGSTFVVTLPHRDAA